jgi:protein-S-isoprenylcysteine O-methyltransferase Ste14
MTVGTLAIALFIAWLATELAFLRPARDRSGSNIDDRSMAILATSNMALPLAAIAFYIGGLGDLGLPLAFRVAGVVVMLTGFATRWAGMWTLRRFFSANVAVQSDHRLIIKGPYRWVRHPGYFGGWLGFVGFGVALGNAFALILLAVCTVPAFLNRIAVEERALRNAFPEYTGYAARVKRFLPLVW